MGARDGSEDFPRLTVGDQREPFVHAATDRARHAWAVAVREPQRRTAPGPVTYALVGMWVLVLATALAGLWKYKLTPGRGAELLVHWPSASSIALAPDVPTLLLFAHPRCPCTRATLAELRQVLSSYQGRVAARVVFFDTRTRADDWTNTDTYTLAASIPGVTLSTDFEGSEAARFGAATSGHVVLYSPRGELLFSGGITPARNHEGDSPGRRRLLAALAAATGGAAAASTRLDTAASGAGSAGNAVGSVYGCPLREHR